MSAVCNNKFVSLMNNSSVEESGATTNEAAPTKTYETASAINGAGGGGGGTNEGVGDTKPLDKAEIKRREKEKKEADKEREKEAKRQSKTNLKKKDSLNNSGAMLVQVQKVGSEADLSRAGEVEGDEFQGGKGGGPMKPPRHTTQNKNKTTATTRGGGPVQVCRVMLLDGTDFEVEITRNALGRELLDKVCEYINLLEKDYFACSYRIGTVKFWLNNDKSISKQIKKNPWVFAFELKFYPPDPTCLREELTRYQVYLQVRVDALSGNYAVQSQLGDYDVESHGPGYEYLKGVSFAPNQTEELLDKIAELHRTQRGLTPGEAEMHYLGNAKNLAMYGVHTHQAQDSAGAMVHVGVCAAGLVVYKERLREHRWTWPKILKISYKRNKFFIQIRPEPDEPKTIDKMMTYRLQNLTLAKRLWKIAAEHHTFFRLREPVPTDRGMFWRMGGTSYRFSGHTQFQSQQASDQINRSGFGVNRLTGGRFTDRLRSVDALEAMYSTERSEETQIVLDGYKTMTLDLKRRNKASVPFADDEEEGGRGGGGGGVGGWGGIQGNETDDSRAQLYPVKDAAGRVVWIKKSTESVSSVGDVFMTLPGERSEKQSHVDFLNAAAGYNGQGGGVTYSKTPYPTGPGYLTPGTGPDFSGAITPGGGGGGYLGGPGGYNSLGRGGLEGGYVTPGGQAYGPPGYGTVGGYGTGGGYHAVEDMHRVNDGRGDQMGGDYYNQTGGYGTGARYGPGMTGRQGQDYADSGYDPASQDDHLKQHMQGGRGGAGEGGWGVGGTCSTTSRTTTRTYTAEDGTVITENRIEKDGVVETRVEKRRTQLLLDDNDVDEDQALRDAIRSVTDLDEDLSVEKIEIETKTDE